MGDRTYRVPSRYNAVIGEILRAHAPDYERLLANANIDVQALEDPDGTLTLGEFEALIELVSTTTGRSDLGYEVGRQIRPNSHGPLGYAMLSCQDADQVLRLAVRYYHLMAPSFTMRYERHERFAEILFTPSALMHVRTLQFFLEALAISFHVQTQLIIGPVSEGYDIYLSMDAPPHAHLYHANAPARFHFTRSRIPGVTVRIPTNILDKPLPMADERVVRRAEAQCEALSRKSPQMGEWGEYVAMMISESANLQLTLEDVARSLNITPRSISRYLSQEGLGFRDISKRIRFERACELLEAGRLNVSQIAFQVGFTDIANFSRGFRRYKGISPTAYASDYARLNDRARLIGR